MTLNIRIGINPIGWSNDDLPSLGGETPLETALKEGAEIGYQGFELGNKFPKTGPALKAKLDEFGVVCVSGWYSAQLALADFSVEDEMKNARQHMEKLAYNDCKVVVYGETGRSIQGQIDTPLSQRPRIISVSDWQRYGDKLNRFGAHLQQEYGITIAYHHHMGAVCESPQDLEQLMNATDPAHVGLLFDTGHCYFGQADNQWRDIDVTVQLKQHIARVNHVHCKDVRAEVIRDCRNRNSSFLEAVLAGAFTVPSDGAIDFASVISVLNEANYQGWLVVEAEQDPVIAPSYEYGEKGYRALEALTRPYQK